MSASPATTANPSFQRPSPAPDKDSPAEPPVVGVKSAADTGTPLSPKQSPAAPHSKLQATTPQPPPAKLPKTPGPGVVVVPVKDPSAQLAVDPKNRPVQVMPYVLNTAAKQGPYPSPPAGLKYPPVGSLPPSPLANGPPGVPQIVTFLAPKFVPAKEPSPTPKMPGQNYAIMHAQLVSPKGGPPPPAVPYPPNSQGVVPLPPPGQPPVCPPGFKPDEPHPQPPQQTPLPAPTKGKGRSSPRSSPRSDGPATRVKRNRKAPVAVVYDVTVPDPKKRKLSEGERSHLVKRIHHWMKSLPEHQKFTAKELTDFLNATNEEFNEDEAELTWRRISNLLQRFNGVKKFQTKTKGLSTLYMYVKEEAMKAKARGEPLLRPAESPTGRKKQNHFEEEEEEEIAWARPPPPPDPEEEEGEGEGEEEYIIDTSLTQMERLKKWLSVEGLDSLSEFIINDLGVQSLKMFAHVNEEDLKSLKPIPRRFLLYEANRFRQKFLKEEQYD